MADKFIKLADGYYVSPQISPDDIAHAKTIGATTIINNRPDHEAADQPLGADIEAAAQAAGLSYVAIPIGPGGITNEDLINFAAAVEKAETVLAFCRTGTRSTILRAVAAAKAGREIDEIIAEAAQAGYDLSAQRPVLEGMR